MGRIQDGRVLPWTWATPCWAAYTQLLHNQMDWLRDGTTYRTFHNHWCRYLYTGLVLQTQIDMDQLGNHTHQKGFEVLLNKKFWISYLYFACRYIISCCRLWWWKRRLYSPWLPSTNSRKSTIFFYHTKKYQHFQMHNLVEYFQCVDLYRVKQTLTQTWSD